ncbi:MULTISPECIES: bifunctional folylpolyglutamate synthase/dihydrofolate synthase [Thermus]|uniref:tetrahydrofolate synthase n=1 Tax=Thermus thermophilus (strain ATCC 27634 / DSM 579 / HB8) TaxID=300852 RepID=Q5SIM9_THET8|nr:MULTISPECIES: Mur ligase family protein [Thermus]QZY57932.1 bifunctional folylpolyglutamate synthase/dihydrofolate synthase [Thermus thermophilus]BAD71163.1 folyl-polyglutamate synthetase [Thermus thermophilus HB8]BDA37956.1 bifunctional folylpolyglutamate synthase/dihydrofolate synthase [Thermus thermophilus]BDE45681.1 bifunctional folylpolyglutamate synthase/dihydrofolate synthase [Thermus thermophilus]HAH40021.1 bifunctional folylpolyglutamate synthase/dihydrofolate synthase [Thermus sp.
MTYEEALAWLYARRRTGERGTHRVRALLARLGHPEAGFLAVHVLGTNGKGSVVAYLEAAFRAAGLAYGAYTSPHLVDFRERIRTHLGPVPREAVVRFVAWAREEAWEEPPGFFDLATALAFLHFRERGVALAAVEAGVGGEKDATNALSRVALTVLTNVGEDHLEALGGTLEAVAREKAGAFRPGVPVVTGARGVGLEVARKVAEERGAPLYVLDPEDPLFALPAPPGLRGAYQEENARLAAAALRLLGLPEAAIARGLREARHPGRMERFLLKGVEVYLDGAHNPPAAEALAREFSAYHLVFGAFPRKDVKGVLAHLLPKARSVRYARAGEGALGGELGTPFFEDPWEALEDALARAREDGLPVLATGSLYLVGRLRERLVAGLGEDLP